MNQAIQTDYTTREYNNPVKWDGIKQGMIYPNSFFNLVTQKTNSITETETVSQTEAVSLESMLKAKYPSLVYHVFDASSGYWRTRNDYPHYLLYQEGDKAKETLTEEELGILLRVLNHLNDYFKHIYRQNLGERNA